jgi:hypothetical protein
LTKKKEREEFPPRQLNNFLIIITIINSDQVFVLGGKSDGVCFQVRLNVTSEKEELVRIFCCSNNGGRMLCVVKNLPSFSPVNKLERAGFSS